MSNTKQFARCFAVKPAKSVAPAAADLWGGATDPAVEDAVRVPLINVDIQDGAEMLDDTSNNCTTNANKSETVLNDAQVTVETDFYTEGMQRIFPAMFGFEEGVIDAGSGSYGHLHGFYPYGIETRAFTADEIADGLATANDRVVPYFHSAEKLGSVDVVAKNVALNDWSVSVESGQALKMNGSGIAEKVLRLTGASRVSGDWTNAAGWETRFRLIDATAVSFGPLGGLTSRDLFAMEINATLGRTAGDPHSGSGAFRSEPIVNSLTEITGTLTLNRVDADMETLQAAMKANTTYAFAATFTRGGKVLSVCIPALQITSVSKDLGDIPKTIVEFKAVLPAIASDSFAAIRTMNLLTLPVRYQYPVYFVVKNTVSTNSMLNS
jgi:hypothetical protein